MQNYQKEITSMLIKKIEAMIDKKSMSLFFDVMKNVNGVSSLDLSHEHSIKLYGLHSASKYFNYILEMPQMDSVTKEKFDNFFASEDFDNIVLNVASSKEIPAPINQYNARLLRDRILGAEKFIQAFPSLEKKLKERYSNMSLPFKISPTLKHLEYAQKTFTREHPVYAPLYAIKNLIKHIKKDDYSSIIDIDTITPLKQKDKTENKKRAIDTLIKYIKENGFLEHNNETNNTIVTLLAQITTKKKLKEENIELRGDNAFFIRQKDIISISNFSALSFLGNFDFIDGLYKIKPNEWLAFGNAPFEILDKEDSNKALKNKLLKLIAKNFQDIDKKIQTPEGNILNSLIPPAYLNDINGGIQMKPKKIENLVKLLKDYPEFYEIREDNGIKHSPFSTLFIAQFTETVTYSGGRINFLDLLEAAPKENINLVVEHFNKNFDKYFDRSLLGLANEPTFQAYSQVFQGFIELIKLTRDETLENNLLSKAPAIDKKLLIMSGDMSQKSFLYKARPFITEIEMNRKFTSIAEKNQTDNTPTPSFKL